MDERRKSVKVTIKVLSDVYLWICDIGIFCFCKIGLTNPQKSAVTRNLNIWCIFTINLDNLNINLIKFMSQLVGSFIENILY